MANVLTLKAEIEKEDIIFSGTTEEGVLAVSCSLTDKDGKEIDFNSVVVEDGRFSGEFSANENAKTVKCANYDGGAIVVAELAKDVVEEPEEENKEEGDEGKNDEETGIEADTGTGDHGFFTAGNSFAVGSVGIVLVVAIFGAILVFRRKKQSQR